MGMSNSLLMVDSLGSLIRQHVTNLKITGATSSTPRAPEGNILSALEFMAGDMIGRQIKKSPSKLLSFRHLLVCLGQVLSSFFSAEEKRKKNAVIGCPRDSLPAVIHLRFPKRNGRGNR